MHGLSTESASRQKAPAFARIAVLLLLCLLVFPLTASGRQAKKPFPAWKQQCLSLAGGGAFAFYDADGTLLFGHNVDAAMVPASAVKILTALIALDTLGSEFHFTTDCYYDVHTHDLLIKGYGDPLLISEEWQKLATTLVAHGVTQVRHILLDDSYFSGMVQIHGTVNSLNPYDAPNLALSANFNTIHVQVDAKGIVSSAEEQTPLTPFSRSLARSLGIRGRQRISLQQQRADILTYVGELAAAFLRQAGATVTGRVISDGSAPATAPTLRYTSSFNLDQVVQKMMRFSNNFIANQLFLFLGARTFGPPASALKSRRFARLRIPALLGVTTIQYHEGSGISRRTRMSCRDFHVLLQCFAPHRHLLHEWLPGVRAKTGGLTGVSTAAGYIVPAKGEPVLFAVMLAGKQAARWRVKEIIRLFQAHYKPAVPGPGG